MPPHNKKTIPMVNVIAAAAPGDNDVFIVIVVFVVAVIYRTCALYEL